MYNETGAYTRPVRNPDDPISAAWRGGPLVGGARTLANLLHNRMFDGEGHLAVISDLEAPDLRIEFYFVGGSLGDEDFLWESDDEFHAA